MEYYGIKDVVDKVTDGTSMFFTETEPYYNMDGYPCQYMDVKLLR